MEDDAMLMKFKKTFPLIRVIDNVIVPDTFNLTASVSPIEDMTAEEITMFYVKMSLFCDEVIPNSLAVASDNDAGRHLIIGDDGVNRTGNLIMLLPGEPSDDLLSIIMQAKLSALTEGKFDIFDVSMETNSPIGISFVFDGEGRDMLPDIDTWIGPHRYFDKPWWDRNDASTMDIIPADDADLSVKPDWAFSIDLTLDEENETAPPPKTGFNPTIIPGKAK